MPPSEASPADDWAFVKWPGADPEGLERLPPEGRLPWRSPRPIGRGGEEE